MSADSLAAAGSRLDRLLRRGRGAMALAYGALLALTLPALAGGAVLSVTMLGADAPPGPRPRIGTEFAPVALIAGAAMVLVGRRVIGAIAAAGSRPARAWLLALVLAVMALLGWIAAMHAGTWLEWRRASTPLGYGTEWFYADIYLRYWRDAWGRGVALAMAAAIGVLPATLLATAFWMLIRSPRRRPPPYKDGRSGAARRPQSPGAERRPGQ